MFSEDPSKKNPQVETLITAQADGFSVRTFEDACVHFHWHLHPEVELTCIREGRGVLHAGDSATPFTAGDVCLLGSGLPHAYGSDPRERLGARWSVMHFLPAIWGEAFWKMNRNRDVASLLKLARQGLVFRGSVAEHCSDLLQSLESKANQKSGMSRWMEIMECLAGSPHKQTIAARDFPGQDSLHIDPRLRKVMRWIDKNACDDSLTQAAAARVAQMAPSAFCRFFRLHTGKTFRDYLNEVRIARTCAHLSNPELNISAIAFESGFGNLANFNRQFKRIVGRTPREYRALRAANRQIQSTPMIDW